MWVTNLNRKSFSCSVNTAQYWDAEEWVIYSYWWCLLQEHNCLPTLYLSPWTMMPLRCWQQQLRVTPLVKLTVTWDTEEMRFWTFWFPFASFICCRFLFSCAGRNFFKTRFRSNTVRILLVSNINRCILESSVTFSKMTGILRKDLVASLLLFRRRNFINRRHSLTSSNNLPLVFYELKHFTVKGVLSCMFLDCSPESYVEA